MRRPANRRPGPAVGAHTYPGTGPWQNHRFHLRVDAEGQGVLLVDASQLIFLNGTALDYVRCLLEGKDDKQTARHIQHRYRGVRRAEAIHHYHHLQEQLRRYLAGDEAAIEALASHRYSMGADELPAPYRMDLALTYRCNNDCRHCYNETRQKPELSLDQWRQVLDKLWQAGVPHIVFTGGEATLHPHLRQLVAHAQGLGQITGLITHGRHLTRPGYLGELIEAGLDHVQVTLLSHQEAVHDRLTGVPGSWRQTVEGLQTAVACDLYLVTNTTLMESTAEEAEQTLGFLIDLGVRNISFNTLIRSGKGKQSQGITYPRLAALLDRLKALAQRHGVNLRWYTPTPYCEFNPLNHGLGLKQCTASSIAMAVEPNGDVLPCQSYYRPLGNLLTDPWDQIWDHQLSRRLRNREYLPPACRECELKQVCGGGCPLSIEHGDYGACTATGLPGLDHHPSSTSGGSFESCPAGSGPNELIQIASA